MPLQNGPDAPPGPGEPYSAAGLLSGYAEDPLFWLRYAEICQNREQCREATVALAKVEELAGGMEGGDAPGDATLQQAVRWRRQKVFTDLLKLVARGRPEARACLVRNLERLVALQGEAISQHLAAYQAFIPGLLASGRPEDARRARHFLRLGAGLQGDLGRPFLARYALAQALMNSGRYGEAEALFQAPAFTPAPDLAGPARAMQALYPPLLRWINTLLANPLAGLTPFQGTGDRYLFALVVWGDGFLDALEQFTLPSLLAPGNLPHLKEAGEARLVLLTTEAGAERLERMPALAAVRREVAVDLVTFPTELAGLGDNYHLMSLLHVASMAMAKAAGAHFGFLAPDIVVADNFLATLTRKVREGVDVLFVPGLMLQMETFQADQAIRFPAVDGVLAISPRDLQALGLRHLHPYARAAYRYEPVLRRPSASVLHWPLANGGFLVHAFHITPFMVSAEAMARFDGSLFFTIDSEFPLKILRGPADLDRCAVLTDTLETNYFELSRGTRHDFGTEFDHGRLCRWGALQGDVARWLFTHKTVYDPDGAAGTDPAYAASSRVVETLLQGLDDLRETTPHLPLGLDLGTP